MGEPDPSPPEIREIAVVGLNLPYYLVRADGSVMEEKIYFSWTMWYKHNSTSLFDSQGLNWLEKSRYDI